MPYAAHIERVDFGNGISLSEWETYVGGDSEFAWQPEARVTSPKGEVIVLPTPHCALWSGARGETALFCWRRGGVHFDGPTPQSIAKAKAIAKALRATVVGDEGEPL
jgi:hypothetical protein